MDNGDAVITSLAARAVDQDLLLWRNFRGFCGMESFGTQVTLRGELDYNYLERAENEGNGEWRM